LRWGGPRPIPGSEGGRDLASRDAGGPLSVRPRQHRVVATGVRAYECAPMLPTKLRTGLTFDDVLLQPAESAILPRDAQLGTRLSRNLRLKIPLLSAAMDTVTGAQTAIAMAQAGGIGVVHKNMSPAQQAEQVARVKKYESGVVT